MLTKLIKIYLKTSLPGRHRLTVLLSKHITSLQSIPVQTENGIVYGDLRISSAQHILAYPNYETGEGILMSQLIDEGDVVFDVGAHVGYYSLLFSKLVGQKGQVCAFEPNSELLKNLKSTVAKYSNIKLFPVGLSDEEGEVSFFVPEDASMASLRDWTDRSKISGSVHQISCELAKMDKLVAEGAIPPPDFIKCDVEGAELAVFKGGEKNIDREDAPIIMFEVNAQASKSFGNQSRVYSEFLESLSKPKYSFFNILSDGKVEKVPSTDFEFANIVAVPQSKLGKLKM